MLPTAVRPNGAHARFLPLCPNCGRPMHQDTHRSGERDVFKCGECGVWAVRSAQRAYALPEPELEGAGTSDTEE